MALKVTNEHLKFLAKLAWQADGWTRVACLASGITGTAATAASTFLAAEIGTDGYVRSSLTIPDPFTVAFDSVQNRAECPIIKASFNAPDAPLTYSCLFVLATKASNPNRIEAYVNFSPDETIPMGRSREFSLAYNLAGGNGVDVETE